MSELNEILSRLRGVETAGKDKWRAFCPSHDDRKTKSLSIGIGDNGQPILYCHATSACSFAKIMDTLGFNKTDYGTTGYGTSEIETTYDYCDESSCLLYQVVRYKPKSFRQRRPDGNDWIWDLKGVTPVLYNLLAVKLGILNNQIIYFVEGEKDADNLIKEGLIATTMSGGSKSKWLPQYTETLKDAMVVLIPDNDVAGREWANRIGGILYGWVKMLKVVYLYGELKMLGQHLNGKDVTDWLVENTVKDLGKLVLKTKDFMPEGAVTREEYEALKRHLIYLHNDFIKHKAFRKRNSILL